MSLILLVKLGVVTTLNKQTKIGEVQVHHGKLRIGLEKDDKGWILIVRRGNEEWRKRLEELSFEEIYASIRMTTLLLPPPHLVADAIFRLLNVAREYQQRNE
ncbi:hypothetical protein B6U96_06435 [Archaeoglobales archaeon ex4484_92]|nr:MAG: hypothetical protein B6U96_06435 [Archaeoglobales archaeon ex4484_92]